MKTALIIVLNIISLSAMADYKLSKNSKAIVCFGEDNQSFNLNASRTTLKYTVEGESNGPKKITKTITNNRSYVSYQTSEGFLVLSNSGDYFKFAGESESESVRCR